MVQGMTHMAPFLLEHKWFTAQRLPAKWETKDHFLNLCDHHVYQRALVIRITPKLEGFTTRAMCYCSQVYRSVVIWAWLTLVELLDIRASTNGSVGDGWSVMPLARLDLSDWGSLLLSLSLSLPSFRKLV